MSAVRFVEVTKRFPGVTALAGVSFDVEAGTCHAVCGENGAGKSTLGKVLAGIERPDEGAVELGGARVRFDSPRDAIGAGVAIVHQELAFCENLSVAENLCLGALPGRNGFVRRAALHERARAMLAAIAADIDPARAMSTLSVAEQQLVQIAAAVGAGGRVIVFYEPTSSLGGGGGGGRGGAGGGGRTRRGRARAADDRPSARAVLPRARGGGEGRGTAPRGGPLQSRAIPRCLVRAARGGGGRARGARRRGALGDRAGALRA